MAIPLWRQRQIDDAAVVREERARERMGVVCGIDPDPDVDESTDGVCSTCFQRRIEGELVLDGKGGMICRGCLEALR